MQENDHLMELNKHMTDTEIMRAIRYLDPDLAVERTGHDADMALGICITLFAALASVLTYIGIYLLKP